MPSLDLDNNTSAYQIRAYASGMIQINQTTYSHSLIVTPNQLIEDWKPQTIKELSAASLAPILSLKPSILLIGTGTELVFLSADIYGHLINAGIGVEVMDTRAACRTFNVLTAEDRNVVAALVIR